MLVPELCRMTGIDDAMRNDFKLMESLSQYTRMAPKNRVDRLMGLSRRLTHDSKEGIEDLKEWGMRIDPNLLEVKGRVLDPEKIFFEGKQFNPNNYEGCREFTYNRWPTGKDPGADWSHGQFKLSLFFPFN